MGYEFTVYTTPEGNMTVELCAIIYSPDTGAPLEVIVSASTRDGYAGRMKCQILQILYTS